MVEPGGPPMAESRVTIEVNIEDGSLRAAATRANEWLRPILAEAPGGARAVWEGVQRKQTGDEFAELRVNAGGAAGWATGLFTETDLAERRNAEFWFRSLCGAALSRRVKESLDRMTASPLAGV